MIGSRVVRARKVAFVLAWERAYINNAIIALEVSVVILIKLSHASQPRLGYTYVVQRLHDRTIQQSKVGYLGPHYFKGFTSEWLQHRAGGRVLLYSTSQLLVTI